MGLARLERILRCALAALLLLGTAARADSFIDVSALSVERSDEGVLLSANLRFDLPVVVDDALAKGIPMFFVADAFLMRDRWYWYDKQVASATRHMRLSYQPLTRRWRLVVSAAPVGTAGLALGQIFDSREEALAAVQRISHWKIADLQELDPEARYSVDFRFRLDVSQLPRPFQIGTVGHGDWSINAARKVRLAPEPAR